MRKTKKITKDRKEDTKMINNVVLTGRLTKDIELRRTTSGKTCTSFTLAVSRNKQ